MITHRVKAAAGKTLSVQSKAEAEARLTQMGYTFLWQQDDSLVTTTPRLPATKRFRTAMCPFSIGHCRAWMAQQRFR